MRWLALEGVWQYVSMGVQVVAMGGGGFSEAGEVTRLDVYILGQAGVRTPRVCFIPTASGDDGDYVAKYYAAFSRVDCEPHHLALTDPPADLDAFVMAQDVFYVGGGTVETLLESWRSHGLDASMRRVAARGAVLAGLSAGAMCWFDAVATELAGKLVASARKGLGLLAGSFCPHYQDPAFRAGYQHLVQGGFPGGYGADDGAALHFVDGELHAVVVETDTAQAYRVEFIHRRLVETALTASTTPPPRPRT